MHEYTSTRAHVPMHAQNTCMHVHLQCTHKHMHTQNTCAHACTNTHARTVTLVPTLSADFSEFRCDFAAWGPLSGTMTGLCCAFRLHLGFRSSFSFQKEIVVTAHVQGSKSRRGAVGLQSRGPGVSPCFASDELRSLSRGTSQGPSLQVCPGQGQPKEEGGPQTT